MKEIVNQELLLKDFQRELKDLAKKYNLSIFGSQSGWDSQVTFRRKLTSGVPKCRKCKEGDKEGDLVQVYPLTILGTLTEEALHRACFEALIKTEKSRLFNIQYDRA